MHKFGSLYITTSGSLTTPMTNNIVLKPVSDINNIPAEHAYKKIVHECNVTVATDSRIRETVFVLIAYPA